MPELDLVKQAEYPLVCPEKYVIKFNQHQKFLYMRAIKGLKVYNANEVKTLSEKRKRMIITNTMRCRRIMNIYKQRVLNEKTNKFFVDLFPRSAVSKFFYDEHSNSTHNKFIIKLTFKDLGISKYDMVYVMFCTNVLPENFYVL